MKNLFLNLFYVGIVLLLVACEMKPAATKVSKLAESSDFYVLDIRKDFPRTGFTLLDVNSFQQATDYSCGPAAVLTLLRYYGKDGDEMTIAKEMGSSSTCGTRPEQMTAWLNLHGFIASWYENGNLDTLRNNLNKRIPTLVEWSDWGGHWVLVVGYDTRNTETISDDVIIFADPYDRHDDKMDGLTNFNAERFYYMWYDALLFGKVMKRITISAKPS
ncbi:MAG: C39 family peptidase [Bacteroidales bacterium]